MSEKELNKRRFTENAKLKARQNGESTWMYHESGKVQYFVTAQKDGTVKYWKA